MHEGLSATSGGTDCRSMDSVLTNAGRGAHHQHADDARQQSVGPLPGRDQGDVHRVGDPRRSGILLDDRVATRMLRTRGGPCQDTNLR